MINSIYTAISALKAFQKKLGVTANNVSNAQTPGFKMSIAGSQDISPEDAYTASGVSQIGRGTAVESIVENFSQGSFEPSSSETDMALDGEGFFVVMAATGERYYTRDGEFWFDKGGRLVNASGYAVQGWAFDPISGQAQGSVQDIVIPSFTSPPQGTSVITNIVNLEAGAKDNTVGLSGLSNAWNGGDPHGDFMPEGSYSYQTITKVYDSVGGSYDITIYFDKGGTNSGWDYIVAMNPGEDRRPGASGKDLGLLARGTLTFDVTGAVSNMTLENDDGAGNWTAQDPATDLTGGHFTFHPDFLGGAGGTTGMSIQLDFGSSYNGVSWTNETPSSTQYFSPSKTAYTLADGYGAGDLQTISIMKDGVISGHFSNGRTSDLFQITIANFNNPQGLKKIGKNLYAETTDSGYAVTEKAGTGRAGTIVSNAREQSNVDIAAELVNTILIQRGFQVNLKVISTQDHMLGSLLDVFS